MVLDGPINGAAFVAYIEQCLAPTPQAWPFEFLLSPVPQSFMGLNFALARNAPGGSRPSSFKHSQSRDFSSHAPHPLGGGLVLRCWFALAERCGGKIRQPLCKFIAASCRHTKRR
jgi:hypothetical protein